MSRKDNYNFRRGGGERQKGQITINELDIAGLMKYYI